MAGVYDIGPVEDSSTKSVGGLTGYHRASEIALHFYASPNESYPH